MQPGRRVYLALLLVALVVNLPFLHHSWQQWRIDRHGIHVNAEVTGTDVLRERSDPHFVVRLRLPADVDPERRTWPAEVDEAAWQQAKESRRIGVTVLRDDPAAQHVDGERASALGYVIIGVVDGVLVLVALLVWRMRRHGSADDPGAGPSGPVPDWSA